MEKDTINLYVTTGCPKCRIIKEMCKNNPKIVSSDFKIIDVINDETDTDFQLLIEKGMTTFPVLLVNDDFMNFSSAVEWLRS